MKRMKWYKRNKTPWGVLPLENNHVRGRHCPGENHLPICFILHLNDKMSVWSSIFICSKNSFKWLQFGKTKYSYRHTDHTWVLDLTGCLALSVASGQILSCDHSSSYSFPCPRSFKQYFCPAGFYITLLKLLLAIDYCLAISVVILGYCQWRCR